MLLEVREGARTGRGHRGSGALIMFFRNLVSGSTCVFNLWNLTYACFWKTYLNYCNRRSKSFHVLGGLLFHHLRSWVFLSFFANLPNIQDGSATAWSHLHDAPVCEDLGSPAHPPPNILTSCLSPNSWSETLNSKGIILIAKSFPQINSWGQFGNFFLWSFLFY